MPLITTHNFFANDVYALTPKNITNTFQEKKNSYELFAQGFDPFVFYEFFKPKKKDLQGFCHINQTDTFFLNYIHLLKEKHLEENPTLLAILYGHLTHYVLDSTEHPYIVYKTGEYHKENPETLKYNGKHNKMEMQIDAYLYEQKFHKPYKNFAIHKNLITKEKLKPEILSFLNEIYEHTFQITKGGEKYQKGCQNMYYSYKFLIVDRTGLKKILYKGIDKLTKKKKGVYENYSAHVTNIPKTIFNNEHLEWQNPWDATLKSTESFFDLYEKAKKRCTELFKATHEFLHNQIKEEEYKQVLKDYSYVTGFSWHDKRKLQHLEF